MTSSPAGRQRGCGTNADGGFDEVAVRLVLDGYRMALHGADRHEAVRRMVLADLTRAEIAQRVKLSRSALEYWARRHGVALPDDRPARHWTYDWVEARRDPENRRRWKNGDFAGDGTGHRLDA